MAKFSSWADLVNQSGTLEVRDSHTDTVMVWQAQKELIDRSFPCMEVTLNAIKTQRKARNSPIWELWVP